MPLRTNPNQKWDALRKTALDARRIQDKEAWMNIAFYLGDQYSEYLTLDDGSGLLRSIPEEVPGDVKLPRPTVNKIMHFANQSLAFAMQARPTADVLPADMEGINQSHANVANAYVRYLQEPNVTNWEKTMWDANLWAVVANEAYLKWVWNPETQHPDVMFCPSTDVYSDPYVRDFYKSRWVIHSQFLDPEAVYEAYGKEVKPNDQSKADLQKSAMLRDLGQAPVLRGVEVNELWYLPCRRHPKGLFRVWAGNEILVEDQDFPYEHGGKPALPFTQIGCIPQPNSKHYYSPVTFLRAPQMELNKYHAQRLMTREFWANLKLWLGGDTELVEPWDNSVMQVLRSENPNATPPQVIGPPGALPDNQDGDWLAAEMQNIVGLHEISQGQVPGRVEAAKAIELLRESDTSRLAVLLATQGISISRGWWQALMLARQYQREEVVVQAYSPEGVPEVHKFMTDTFDPGMRIRVSVGSGLAFSRSARLDQLTTLWTAGVIRDQETFARLADLPIPQIISSKQFDVMLARNENITMGTAGKDGKPQAIQANSWDDHTIHIREHNDYRKTLDFHSLTDATKERFAFHVSQHETMETAQLEKEAKRAAALAAASGGSPSAVPPPPGPGSPAPSDEIVQ